MLSWQYFGTSSDLLLMKMTGDTKIWYFSVKHKLLLFELFVYGLAWSITYQCVIGFLLLFFFWFSINPFLNLVLEEIVVCVKLAFNMSYVRQLLLTHHWWYSLSNCIDMLVLFLGNFPLEDRITFWISF